MSGEAKVLAQLALWKVALVALLVVATWLLLKWMHRFLDRVEKHNLRLRFLLRQVEPPLRIMVWFGALMLSAEILAPSKDAFLAALGSAALAIGLGLQDLIKNLIGGLVVVADRPYQTGDRIRVADAHGEVVQIGLRSTKLLTDSGALVTVPNSQVLTSHIFNANAGVPECLVATSMALPYTADAERVMRIGREVAVSCPYTHLGRSIELELEDRSAGVHAPVLSIKAYVYDHRYEGAMRTDILRRARREFFALRALTGPESFSKMREQTDFTESRSA